MRPELISAIVPVIYSALVNFVNQMLQPIVNQSVNDAIKEVLKPHLENFSLIDHQQTKSIEMEEKCSALEKTVLDLNNRLEEQDQYSRRNCLRFHNVKDVTNNNTDEQIIKICKDNLGIDLSKSDISRSHLIGKPIDGKHQIIARFVSYRVRESIFKSKKKLKNNHSRIFITEDLTRERKEIINKLSELKRNSDLDSFWTSDGRIFAKRTTNGSITLIKSLHEAENLI